VKHYHLFDVIISCASNVFVAAYTICNKYGHYCVYIWILWIYGHTEYIQGWTYPLMLLVCCSGMYWVWVGIRLCDELFHYVGQGV